MAALVQKVSNYAEQLLAHLNLQRERAQLCDCVVIQRLNPGRVFPAHRCVLSASSPVLASILSSTGVLVELKDPCLSDSVLAMLLDYIYTGSMQCTQSKEQYYNLLTAATYLQMDELQETLTALQQTNVDAADKTDGCTRADHHPHKDMKDADDTNVNSFSKHQPLSRICIENSTHRKDQTCAANVDTCNKIYSCRSSTENDTNCWSRKDNSSSRNASTICCLSGNTGSCANSDNCTHVSRLATQVLIDFPCTIGTDGVFKEVLKSRSVGIGQSETCPENMTNKVVRTAEDRRDFFSTCTAEQQDKRREENTKNPCLAVKSNAKGEQMKGTEEDNNLIHPSPFSCLSPSTLKDNVSPSQCTSSSSSQHPCCEAVSVICHSSTASMTQLAKLSTMPSYPSIPKASVSVCSRSENTDIDNTVEGTSIGPNDFNGAQNQDLYCKSIQSNKTDHFTRQNNEPSDSAFPHMVNPTDQYAHCDSFQNQLKDRRGDLVSQKRLCRSPIRELKYKLNLSFEDFPSKHQRLDCSDSHNISMATTAKEHTVHLNPQKDKVPLYVQESDTGCDCQCQHFTPEGEVKEEHASSKRYPTNVETQDSNSNLCGPKTDWYQTLQRAETSPKDDCGKRNITMTDQINSVVCPSVPTIPELNLGNVYVSLPTAESSTPLELENVSIQMPVDNGTSDPTSSVMEQSYRAHLHYQCLAQEDTQISLRDPDHLYSSTWPSDQSRDDEEVGTFANPDCKSLSQHFASGMTERVLLLDISTKPAELLVSYKHRSSEGENWVACDHKDTFASVFENNDEEQWDEVPPAHVVDKRKTPTRTNRRNESFDGNETKSWVGDIAKRQSVGKDRSSLGSEVLHEAETIEVRSHALNRTVCTPPTEPVFVQDSTASTLSDSVPSTVSGIVPATKLSQSTPVRHLFQCYLCDRSFSQRGSLNRHVRSHLGVRPFHCPSCPMTFSRQYRVTEHMRVHQRCALGTDFQNASPT